MKDAVFLGTSLGDLCKFPAAARRAAGYEIDQVQRDELPRDWKPFPEIGTGVREIRLHVEGEHRILYVATFREAVYVIHAFQKKSQKTAPADVSIARRRFKALVKVRTEQGWP